MVWVHCQNFTLGSAGGWGCGFGSDIEKVWLSSVELTKWKPLNQLWFSKLGFPEIGVDHVDHATNGDFQPRLRRGTMETSRAEDLSTTSTGWAWMFYPWCLPHDRNNPWVKPREKSWFQQMLWVNHGKNQWKNHCFHRCCESMLWTGEWAASNLMNGRCITWPRRLTPQQERWDMEAANQIADQPF